MGYMDYLTLTYTFTYTDRDISLFHTYTGAVSLVQITGNPFSSFEFVPGSYNDPRSLISPIFVFPYALMFAHAFTVFCSQSRCCILLVHQNLPFGYLRNIMHLAPSTARSG